MQIKKFWKSLTIMGLTTAVLAGNINPIQAQSKANSVHLLDTNCISTTEINWGKHKKLMLTHREPYTSTAYLWGGSGFACNFSAYNSKYKNLDLKFGLNDKGNVNDDVLVNIYLNGNLMKSVELKRGILSALKFDVTKKQSLAIEAVCPKKHCHSIIYFYRLHLDKKSSYPKQSK